MKKIMLAITLVALAMLLTACSSNKDTMNAPTNVPTAPSAPSVDTTPQNTAPATPTETAPSDDGSVTPEASTDNAGNLAAPGEAFAGEPSTEVTGKVGNVRCTAATRKLTFTVHNDGDKTWSLDQQVPFPPPADLVPAKIFINDYEANRFTSYYDADTGEMLFGPNEKFSANCGGVDQLAPGEQAECTLYPVPLKDADAFSNRNRIWVDVPGEIDSAYFTCK